MSEAIQNVATERRRVKEVDTDALDAALRQLVAQCARGASLEDAAEAILEQLDGMPHLNWWFRQRAAHALLGEARNNLRQKIERQAAWTVPEHASKAVEARLAARESLYDYPLPGSATRLGDATVDDLAAAAAYHETRAAAEQARGAIYKQVADMLRRSKKRTVREGVREDRIAQIMRGAG